MLAISFQKMSFNEVSNSEICIEVSELDTFEREIVFGKDKPISVDLNSTSTSASG